MRDDKDVLMLPGVCDIVGAVGESGKWGNLL